MKSSNDAVILLSFFNLLLMQIAPQALGPAGPRVYCAQLVLTWINLNFLAPSLQPLHLLIHTAHPNPRYLAKPALTTPGRYVTPAPCWLANREHRRQSLLPVPS